MHTSDVFKLVAKQASSAQQRMRYLALYHFKRGESRSQTAINLGVARGSVNTWVSNYLTYGLAGLQDKPRPGRTRQLCEAQQKQLKQFIQDNAVKPGGGRLIAEDVRRYIRDTLHVDYELRNVYRIMHSLGFSWITSRSKHPKQSQEAQDAFKKRPAGNDPSHPRPSTP